MIIFFSVLFYHRCGRSILQQDASWASPEALWVKNLPANEGDMGFIPGSRKSPGEGKGNPFQCSCLENSMDRGSLVGYSPEGQKKSNTTEWLGVCTHAYTHKMATLPSLFPFWRSFLYEMIRTGNGAHLSCSFSWKVILDAQHECIYELYTLKWAGC